LVNLRSSEVKLILKRCGALLFVDLSALNDDFLAHEVIEALCVQIRMTGGNEVSVLLLEPNLDEVFGPLHAVVSLEVIDNAHVVDVLSAG